MECRENPEEGQNVAKKLLGCELNSRERTGWPLQNGLTKKKIDSWLKVVQRYTQNRDVDWKIVNSAIGFLRKAIKVRRTSTVIFIKTMRSFAREKGKDLSPEYLLELERWVSSEQRKIEEIKEVCRQAEARHMRESLE